MMSPAAAASVQGHGANAMVQHNSAMQISNGTALAMAVTSASANSQALQENVRPGHYNVNGLAPSAGAASASIIQTHNNEKAEAFAQAHRGRVEAEALAYREAACRKVEARAQKNLAKAERQRLHDESRALETKQREEQKAEQVIRNAAVKAEKILAKAREEANRINSKAQEETEKAIADAFTRAERMKAEIEETKKRELAEITDRVQYMIAVGELPAIEHRGVVQRMKASLVCHT